MRAAHLGQRFFVLTALGYVVALLSCAAVVGTLSMPFLKAAHTEHLSDVARNQASAASFMLDEIYDRAEYLARVPSVMDLVLGRAENIDAVSDRISTFSTDAVRHAKILDYRGRTLYARAPERAGPALFHDVEYREGFDQIGRVADGATREGRLRLRQDPATGTTHLLIAVPILIDGAMEGAVVLEIRLNLESALPGGSQLLTPFQHSMVAALPLVVTASVPGVPLFVRLGATATTSTESASQIATLVGRISLGLSVVLFVPFLAMSYFGARHLVTPTRALAASRARLADQQGQLKRQSEELRELAAVAELSRDAVTVTDADGRIIWVNRAFTELTGYSEEEARGRSPGHLLHGTETDPETVRQIREALDAGDPVRAEIQDVTKDGKPYWVAISISPITDERGQVRRFAAISSDITERRATQEALARAKSESEHRADHDTLTGLPNRRYLDRVLETTVGIGDAPRTLIRVDLDFFKNINDTHGHAAGDHVLQVVSSILRENSREGDLVARVGGDEFVVLPGPGTTIDEADALCERYRTEIRKDIAFEGKICRVGASFGVASALEGPIGNDALLVGADAALYLSKAQGRNTTTLYTPEVHRGVLTKRRSATEIERAIEREEFEPYFQPQVDAQTRGFAGIEALVRWNHPEQGILAPAKFLPLADQLSLVPEIDDIVYRKGLRAVQLLNARGLHVPKVSFNVGARQLENPFLSTIIDEYDLGKTQVAFEVLESVLVEEQASGFAFQIDLLRELGFRIEVDDFGSGHASVVGLLQLRPDAMKLDQRLVMPLISQPEALITVRALIDIGRSQGIMVTAEGVETEEHAKLLTDLGVDTLQGYRFARPLPLDELEVFLREMGGPDTEVA